MAKGQQESQLENKVNALETHAFRVIEAWDSFKHAAALSMLGVDPEESTKDSLGDLTDALESLADAVDSYMLPEEDDDDDDDSDDDDDG